MIVDYNDVVKILKAAGFNHHDTCNCGGSLQHKWKRGDYQIIVFPKKKTPMFKVYNIQERKYDFTGTYLNLEKTVNELV